MTRRTTPKRVVACPSCRTRKSVATEDLARTSCPSCATLMTRKAATRRVQIQCPNCAQAVVGLWSLGPSHICAACGTSAPERSTAPGVGGTGRSAGVDPRTTKSEAKRPSRTAKAYTPERAAATEHLRRFLVAAEIDVRTTRGQLAVDGRPVWVPSLTVRDPLERTIDSVVASRFADRLVAAVEREIEAGAHGLRIAIDRTADRVVVADGREIIAFVSATRWLRYKDRSVGGTGNFLRSGPQWNTLRKHAQRGRRRHSPAQAETRRAQPASLPEIDALPVLTDAQSELHYAFPDGVSQQLVTLGTEASRRLRLERSLSFGHVVHVRSTDGPAAVFSPVHLDRGRPEIDVVFRDGGSTMSLRLRVSGRGDPLPVRAPVGRSAKAVARAWIFALVALVAFADLTTPPDLDHLRPDQPARPP